VDVDQQFTVFGAMGAVVFTILSGALLARFSNPRSPMPPDDMRTTTASGLVA
jgi:hypothetical protein